MYMGAEIEPQGKSVALLTCQKVGVSYSVGESQTSASCLSLAMFRTPFAAPASMLRALPMVPTTEFGIPAEVAASDKVEPRPRRRPSEPSR